MTRCRLLVVFLNLTRLWVLVVLVNLTRSNGLGVSKRVASDHSWVTTTVWRVSYAGVSDMTTR